MTDIMFGERAKKIFRVFLKMGMAKLKLEEKVVAENLALSPNPVIRNFNSVLLAGSNQLKPKFQRDTVRVYGQILLWIIQKDTAYRDVFFWMVDKILSKADELREIIKPYVKPPEEWIPNMWEDSRGLTAKLRKEKKISTDSTSFEESIYQPKGQAAIFKRLNKKK